MGRGTRAAGTTSRSRTAAAPSGKPKAGRGATFSVAMMTLGALAAVGVLAAQAEATAPSVKSPTTTVGSTVKSTSASSTGGGSANAGQAALPANSGSGMRIVYSPKTARAWLVASGNSVSRTMQVVPGTIPVPAGTYTVDSKSPAGTGGDNIQVQYVVKFDSGGTVYGFDAEAGVTGLPPAPTGQTGGVRMAQLDAEALYTFASVGTTIVVV